MTLPRLLVLTDRRQLPAGRELTQTVSACVAAGGTHVVLRELDLPPADRSALAARLLRIPGLVLITARRRLPGSRGVHFAAGQAPVDAGDDLRGFSCHDAVEVRRARDHGASYVTISPAAPTDSKPGYGPPLGQAGIRRLASVAAEVPAFALGGVTAGNADSFREAGAYGVAVMGSLMASADPGALSERLIAEVSR